MAAPILALRDVCQADGARLLLDRVELTLERGERACLVGRNGAGKSTLLRLLAGLAIPEDGERIAHSALKVALAPQEPTIVGVSLEAFVMADGAPSHRARAALESFGLDPDRRPEGLSGGETRRAALARGFAIEPDVLLLDEPTNHLDIVAIEALEARLGKSRAAVLMVSHDRAFLERLATRCFWLTGARVRRLDAPFSAFEAWSETLQAAESESDRRLDKALAKDEHWLRRGVTARRARNEGRRRRLISLRAEKAKRMSEAPRALNLGAAADADRSGTLVIEALEVRIALGGRILIDGFSTRLLRGETLAVIGPNGAGKTTLVRLLTGELAPDQGSVRLGAGVQMVRISQDRSELDPTASLMQTLAPGGGDQIMVGGSARHVAGYAAEFLFRSEQLRQPVASLSGGERNRLLLASALAKPSNLLVLDEPTNDLDIETLTLLEERLAEYPGTVIVVSHDRDFVERLATSTIAMDGRGQVVETPGGWRDFISQRPGFFEPLAVASTSRPAPTKQRQRTAPAKLGFADARRLAELEQTLPSLAKAIAALEAQLSDPHLYGRDRARFDDLTLKLSQARARLAAAEDAWLEIEARREALALGAADGPP
jgi:ATP-binding cassette subfamily F protein uup